MEDCLTASEPEIGTFDDFDTLSVNEVRLKQLPQAEKLQVNDQKASIISIIILIIVAE
jgi:hypothetical protein